MASGIVLNSTNNSEMNIVYKGTSGATRTVVVPDKDMTVASTNEANLSYKPTQVTITSWSYVTTTITLNVASHTFIAGDYIEVRGLTATTNIPNGVHLVTSVTATTIVFTYALTPTGTAGVSSATVKGYMTVNGRTNGIGEGQTWQNVTASRVFGTTYTNTTGKPIFISIMSGVTNNDQDISIIVDGYTVSRSQDQSNGIIVSAEVSSIVPNGSTYSASGYYTQLFWYELR